MARTSAREVRRYLILPRRRETGSAGRRPAYSNEHFGGIAPTASVPGPARVRAFCPWQNGLATEPPEGRRFAYRRGRRPGSPAQVGSASESNRRGSFGFEAIAREVGVGILQAAGEKVIHTATVESFGDVGFLRTDDVRRMVRPYEDQAQEKLITTHRFAATWIAPIISRLCGENRQTLPRFLEVYQFSSSFSHRGRAPCD